MLVEPATDPQQQRPIGTKRGTPCEWGGVRQCALLRWVLVGRPRGREDGCEDGNDDGGVGLLLLVCGIDRETRGG